jgi:CHRD domain
MLRRHASFYAVSVGLCFIVFAGLASAQAPDSYKARLAPVPVSRAELSLVGGLGMATASLSRGRLTLEGSFDGLPSAVTAARLHHGPATGTSGPAIAELEVHGTTSGTIEGEVELDREQRAALIAGHLYVQLYSMPGVPPDNAVLRGWLLGFNDATPTRINR